MSQNKQHPWTLPRAHSRYLLDLRIVVRAKETFIGRTKDIAEGGVGATIPSEINIGEIVELELQLSEAKEPLKIKAEVRTGTASNTDLSLSRSPSSRKK